MPIFSLYCGHFSGHRRLLNKKGAIMKLMDCKHCGKEIEFVDLPLIDREIVRVYITSLALLSGCEQMLKVVRSIEEQVKGTPYAFVSNDGYREMLAEVQSAVDEARVESKP